MRILIMTPGAVGFNSPTVYMAQELKARGHEIGLVQDGTGSKIIAEGPFDVVFGDMERSCISAFLSAATMGLPCYLHGEWVPEFRVRQTAKWGQGCLLSPDEIAQWRAFYRPIAGILHEADVCSWASPIFQKFAEEFSGRSYKNCFARFTRLPPNAPESVPMNKAEYAVCTCSRIAPIKRVPMLIEAVGRMEGAKPKIYIVGDGPERPLVNAMAEKFELDVEIAGATSGIEKWEFIARSRLMLSAWTGISPGEAMMVGRPTIAFDYEHIRELYKDALYYVPNNDIEAMTEKLETLLQVRSKSELESFAHDGRERLLKDELGLQTFSAGVDEVESVLAALHCGRGWLWTRNRESA